ncbi:MAG: phospholipase [bacterium]|nr:phospholipase [bacterium]
MSRSVEEKWIAARTHGRYLVERRSTGAAAPLVLGFHGYGEGAERLLRNLRRIPGSDEWVLCAVQALHRFYHNITGEVIGSWMTSQGREHAIDDNIRYVASVVAEVQREHKSSDRLVLAGFSQGVAMAYRAAFGGGFPCHGLIVLAGDLPPELAAGEWPGSGEWPHVPAVLLGRGTRDTLYTEEMMEKDLELLSGLGIEVEACVFEGGHVWTREFFHAAGAFLRRINRSRQ